ncbi:MAG: DNA topoisomerase I, partial [Paramuribaculum sp.]|nr:DNA topoisomerase I [Paramuribaculum sp.]
FRVTARFTTPDGAQFSAALSERLSDRESAEKFLKACGESTFSVEDVQVKPLKKSPAPPFTTSTLQQDAARKLGFTVSQTMMVAQRLYEEGHITYMRTDSLNLSNEALASIAEEITGKLGKTYLHTRKYQTSSKGAQEAHEAIRPTYINKRELTGATSQERRLYDLIWKRTIASQMADAKIEKTTVDITANPGGGKFVASGETITFDGFLKVYIEGHDDNDSAAEGKEMSSEVILPRLEAGEVLTPGQIIATERFTQHPPRYSEATLVKKMEELGIGRPSTYAPTISTIQQREYVEKSNRQGEQRELTRFTLDPVTKKIETETKIENVDSEKGKLVPTDTGTVVNDFLTKFFPNILDFNFTASVEERFDKIADGDASWKGEISDFYEVFHPEVEKADQTRFEHKPGERVLGIDPASGHPVSVKIGRFGPVVQIGESTDDEKPRFASLRKEQSVFNITLEEALKLFELPRTLGSYEGHEIVVATGRFGPYIRHNGKFVSLPAEISPTEVSLSEAVKVIENKRSADAQKVVKKFDEDPELVMLNGRYGIYLSYNDKNYKIPRTAGNPASLTYDECKKIIEEADASPKPARRTRSKK